jgi:hypothetical protein
MPLFAAAAHVGCGGVSAFRAPLTSVAMSRFPLPAAGALALAVALLGLLVAGCGNSRHASATATAVTPSGPAACKLNGAQRRGLARARADIGRLRRIQAPMQAYSQHGAPNQNLVTGDFIMDLGSAHLPLNTYSRLLHQAKAAVRLCGDCSQGLEAEEPVLGTRMHPRCG